MPDSWEKMRDEARAIADGLSRHAEAVARTLGGGPADSECFGFDEASALHSWIDRCDSWVRALRERDEKATAGLLEMIALLRMKYGETDDPRLPAGPGHEIYEAALREAREGK